ncbi:basic helix-loop-helix (bHLH) DNA-bindingsuperfamily protein [Striga asiatica]|uniref:Basic helix-loop-helix (BHLH) DNA-bindingsuperfamily protein n=1 Tax=Striga asiatica TaxID=4170 RepID=A0A5A7QAV8_STRAF|nr:basic helix-loop-helix (bHLH) DNA-bindingsuperfamily protein [Striga asiatica]
MEISSFNCLADLGMGDPFLMQQWPHNVDSIDGLSSITTTASTFSDDYNFDSNYQSYNGTYHNNDNYYYQPALEDCSNNRPSKQLKTVKKHDLSPISSSEINLPKEEMWYGSSSGMTLNFSSPESVNRNYALKSCQGAKRVISTAQDYHIMAERKRREKLSQRFITLSTLLPGLKKMDKASVLRDAINHIKELQEKVKALEEQSRKKKMEYSMVFIRNLSSDEQSISSGPEIEARFCDREILVSIHCQKRKRVVEKTVAEIEKLHLTVVNSSSISLGDSALNITVVAQKDEEFGMSMKDLVKNLRAALTVFM